MSIHHRRTLLLTCLVGSVACGESPLELLEGGMEGANARASIVTEPATGPWARIVEGETGPGSLYALYLPREWNGEAVFYAHGFRDAASPVDLRDQDGLYAFRDALGERGYAVAYSSYSRNGFAVKDGVQRTHQLRGLLASQLSAMPARSFLAGHSLGGGIALAMVEQFPDDYDGALLLCGMVGGSRAQTQYLGHVRALADVFFPGRFPGDAEGVPVGTVITLPQVIAAVQSNPVGLFAIGSMSQTPLARVPGNATDPATPAFQTLLGSLFGGLSFHARGINDVTDLVNGKSPFDNSATTYALGTNPVLPPAFLAPAVAAANATVTRYTADDAATNYLTSHFTPGGALAMPVLTLHNLFDPAVPFFHEELLRARVTSAGASVNLLQRPVPSYGHCAIPAATAVQGFVDLSNWVRTGARPAN